MRNRENTLFREIQGFGPHWFVAGKHVKSASFVYLVKCENQVLQQIEKDNFISHNPRILCA